MPRLFGRVLTKMSGSSAECFFGWKLALAKPWRVITDLMRSHCSFLAAIQALSITGQVEEDSD
jgi:hypothetical protein